MHFWELVVVVFISSRFTSARAEAPPGYPTCYRRSPNISSCLASAFKMFRQQMNKGFPDFDIPPLDPLRMSLLNLTEDGNSFVLKFHNATVHGMSGFEIQHLRLNVDQLKMEVNMTAPKLTFEGTYEIKGSLLRVPLNGKGTTNFTFWEVPIHVKLFGAMADCESGDGNTTEPKQKGDGEFLNVEKLSCHIDKPRLAHIGFTNLFGGDVRREMQVSKMINDNWQGVFSIYKYVPEQAFGYLFKNVLQNVCSAVPFDRLLPELH